jgi:hypothetical protein
MKMLITFLFCTIFAFGEVMAQGNSLFVDISDETYSMIHPLMRDVEIENIQPGGWFFSPKKDSTRVVLQLDGKSVPLGTITHLGRVSDTVSLYRADTMIFGLSSKQYVMRSKGALYHKELGRLQALSATPIEDKPWIVLGKNSVSKNSNQPLKEILVTKDLHWEANGISNLPGIPSIAIDTVDNNPEGLYKMSVIGPWPWNRRYGSITLKQEERMEAGVKIHIYEPSEAREGLNFTLSENGNYYIFGNKTKVAKVAIMREVEVEPGGQKRTKHRKRTRR